MERNGKKKRIILTAVCITAGVCLAGVIAAAVFAAKKNPLAEGIIGLAEEVTALEEEMGENFWTDAVNQIGSENMRAEYSLNLGGMPKLQNITVGIDGKTDRDMEQKLFGTEVEISVANAKIGEGSVRGTSDTLYLQVPSVWEGSVVLDTENVDGQWNGSAVKKGVEALTGQDLEINGRMDARLFQSFSVEPFSASDFLEKNREELSAIYENMEVIKAGKAQKEGLLSEEQAKQLEEYILKDAEGNQLETTCYLAVLPEEELKEIFSQLTGDIRLGVYLDGERRIVRICTLSGEKLVTDLWEGSVSLNLTGVEATTDSLELEAAGRIYMDEMFSFTTDEADSAGEHGNSGGSRSTEISENSERWKIFEILGIDGTVELDGMIILEKDKDAAGSYQIACSTSVSERENVWKLSVEAGVRGEYITAREDTKGGRIANFGKGADGRNETDGEEDTEGEGIREGNGDETSKKLSIEIENLIMKSQKEVICRGSGEMTFAPLEEEVQIPTGKEYRIGEMDEFQTVLFLAECTENIYKNYSGYMRLME